MDGHDEQRSRARDDKDAEHSHSAPGHDHPHAHEHDAGDHGHDDADYGHDHGPRGQAHDVDHGHDHGQGLVSRLGHAVAHSHAPYERVDSVLESSSRGIRALKLSLVGLGVTALFQLVIAVLSGSIGLLADTIHNFGDATTSIPLWIAFALARRGTNRRYTYGYGRAEDVAGALIVVVIFASAGVAAYESILKLISPQPVEHLGWVAVAALVGFVGNEIVAIFRIRVGREIGSAALVADGQHARIDGFTSLAVLVGVAGVALGAPIFDPLVGLAITLTILVIVKDTAIAVWQRLMGAIEPEILAAVEHAPRHVDGVRDVHEARALWVGHRVLTDLHISVDPSLSVQQAHEIVEQVEGALRGHVPSFGGASIHVCPGPVAKVGAAASAD
jgi:cation diffusion facilitator family transporter